MTTPEATDLAELVQKARVLLLDFDGPICSIFAGHSPTLVAQQLATALVADGETVPQRVHETADPFDVLRFASTLGEDAARRTEARLRQAELVAVPTASPTPGIEGLINAWLSIGRAVAAVSNNSEAAVTAYATQHQLQLYPIIGRTSADAELLKPSPHLLLRALVALDASHDEALLVGDSPSDIDAGNRASVATIGFANKPGKHERLAAAGANLIIDDLTLLAAAVRST
jgi:phosphoglycolate phosphatase